MYLRDMYLRDMYLRDMYLRDMYLRDMYLRDMYGMLLRDMYDLKALPNMDTPFEYVAQCVALYEYEAMEVDELSFKCGDKFLVLGYAQPSECFIVCMYAM
jgi:hypothetical protein